MLNKLTESLIYPLERVCRLKSSESEIHRRYILRLKSIPALKEIPIIIAVDPKQSIQVKQKALTKTFMIISN